MPSNILSAAILGLDGVVVEIEADITRSLTNFFIVGLPDTAVQESRERVRSAIRHSLCDFPRTKVTVNLAPADIRKQGPAYDLPIAISILEAAGQLKVSTPAFFIGELSLQGELRSVHGVLPMALLAREKNIKAVYVAEANASEAALISGLTVYAVNTLDELILHLQQKHSIDIHQGLTTAQPSANKTTYDFKDVQGQEQVKRSLEIAAAGGHNILLSGPPGAGKTLLARSVPSILPPLTEAEALEVSRIYSVAGLLKKDQPLMSLRPFRAPHHTASGVALVGGGAWPKPGEISLAHRGVLFLDEFPEFPRSVLDNLRQPLEDGLVCVSRAAGTITFPASFILIAAQNPCPCGYYSDTEQRCSCSPGQILKYQKKISGPLLDRIDLQVEVPRLDVQKLQAKSSAESSADVRVRVVKARQFQAARLQAHNLNTNSEMGSALVKKICQLDNQSEKMLAQVVKQWRLSARSYYRLLKVARTIADLFGDEQLTTEHMAEALQYRTQPQPY